MAISSPVRLEGDEGLTTLFANDGSIPLGFSKATVLDGTRESMWVIYGKKDWDHIGTSYGKGRTGTVITKKDGTVDYGKAIVSAQGFDITNPGAVFFEHSNYRGFGTSSQHSVPDLTTSFPQGAVEDVSSVIITGGTWNFYTSYNFTGTKISYSSRMFDFGPGRYNFHRDFELAKSARLNHSRVSGPLKLTGSNGEATIFASTATIQHGFVQAEVTKSSPASIWVIYEGENWDCEAHRDSSIILSFPDCVKASLNGKKAIQSAQGFDISDPGIILFENCAYTGSGAKLEYACPDISSVFPTKGSTGGVLSAIVTGGTWVFYDGFNYTGKMLSFGGVVKFGPGHYKFDDTFLSVKSVWSSHQSASCPLQLTSRTGAVKNIYSSVSQITEKFIDASIPINSLPSMWVLYQGPCWNCDDKNLKLYTHLLYPGQSVSFKMQVQSVQGFNIVDPGVVLFELRGFHGRGVLTQFSVPNICDVSPTEEMKGVSSVIIHGGFWIFYSQPGYGGAPLSLKGKTVFSKGGYDFYPNVIQSVKTYHESVSGPLRLSAVAGMRTIFASNTNISPQFYQADVIPTEQESLWVVYSTTNWNRFGIKDPPGVVIRAGKESKKLTKPISSVQGFNITDPGIIVFESVSFFGYGVSLDSPCKDFAFCLPQDRKSTGVFSVIVTGGVWRFYTERKFKGKVLSIDGETDLGPGEYNFAELVPNNRALSANLIPSS